MKTDPLTPAETRRILERLGLSPKKKRGQNFLVDGNIVRKSLHMAEVGAGDHVVEIGPGLGTLTRALLGAGAVVWAVEIDNGLFQYLDSEVRTTFPGHLHLLHGDAVAHPLAGYAPGAGTSPTAPQGRSQFEERGDTEPHTATVREHALGQENAPGHVQPAAPNPAAPKVVANLPYAISTPWLETLLRQPLLPPVMALMLQKEAADRYVAAAGSKSFGAVSIFLQSAYERESSHLVSRSCFYPAPDIDSTLLLLRLRKEPYIFQPEVRQLIRAIFTQRRKQIKSQVGRAPELMEPWIERLQVNGIAPTSRPETIPLPFWRLLG